MIKEYERELSQADKKIIRNHKPAQAIRELRTYVKNYGFNGLQIVQYHWNPLPTLAYFYPLFAKCVCLDIPVCLQAGHTGFSNAFNIDQIALDFPNLNIVCGYIGYPEMNAVATKHLNADIDTSAQTSKRHPKELVVYMKSHGNNKVMFDTNYPMITPQKCLKNLD